MKFEVRHQKNDTAFVVVLPDEIGERRPVEGEHFQVEVQSENANAETYDATLIADGRSLLIGHKVIRMSKRIVAKRGEQYRMGLSGEGQVMLPTSVHAKIKRPVEPKLNAAAAGGGDIKSPMTGKILAVPVNDGTSVNEGDTLVVIEAMKMENRILAECAGTVKSIRAEAGKTITTGELLLTLVPRESQ